ncbi:PAS domain S-box-containing protein/diguanylate cyclase (GGDEF) domain-containing protein [Cohaesibacter sp. ES.047]|uniref:sensor domain-containing protein n=1 Tax=Cohaesibacter sp. ES.047 TaxID=1798205 RepID=UPI000BB6FD55|nr:EAL domain-containing protein [Cohaesibacter sp. ES.047]SNY92005.1 PAS domain S-box-containing protein/diguanylate cyclase (GGDEF) domain-containing protein [Cohaesibacter sp. ES.047]
MHEGTGNKRDYLIAFCLLIVILAGDAVLLYFSFGEGTQTARNALSFSNQIFITATTLLSIGLYFSIKHVKRLAQELSHLQTKAEKLERKHTSHKTGIDSHAIVSITDARGTITYANDKFCEISKYSRDELVGQNHRILNSGYHDKSLFKDMYQKIVLGVSWSGEIRNRAKDGSIYWVATTVMPIYDKDGKLEEIISIRTDITELKLQENALKEYNSLLSATFENFPGSISAYDADFRLQIANPSFYDLNSISEKEFPVGSHMTDLLRLMAERGDLDELGADTVEDLVDKAFDQDFLLQPHVLEKKMSNGKVLEIKGWPIEGGGFVSSHIDVTERSQMIEDLKFKREEAEQASRDLSAAQREQIKTNSHLLNSINSMKNGFVIWDCKDRLVMANDAFRHFNGPIAEHIKPGLLLRELLTLCVEKQVWRAEGWETQALIDKRNESLEENGEIEHEIALYDGTQLVVTDRKLSNGDILSTYADVTTARAREAELRRTRDALQHIAYYDALTTLPNRARCQQDLEKKFKSATTPRRFAIVQIDLDRFKRVNDTMGHAVGDHLLKEIGTRLMFLAEKVHTFHPYRWGGDEFVATVEVDCTTDLEDLCQELTDLVAIPVQSDTLTLWPTASLGVAVYPDDASDLESLMIYADLALYKTKEMGRDGYQFFAAEMKEKVDSDIEIETDVRTALEQDQFELYFQPQISTIDERVTGIEALLRWNHPEKGQLPPGLFMDVVEQHGMASALGRTIFEKAMIAARKWIDEGLDFGRLSINLSPSHLKKNILIDDFFESVERHGVNPDLLAVELLESTLMDNKHPNIMELVSAMAARGVHIELDDFGTGYASLSHLSNLPVDGIKIDRSFVSNISSCEKQQAIVEVVMSMSKLMQLRVVCEGIETHQQLSTVSQIANCSVQGYLVSRPLSFDLVTKWLREKRYEGVLTPPPPRKQDDDDKATTYFGSTN